MNWAETLRKEQFQVYSDNLALYLQNHPDPNLGGTIAPAALCPVAMTYFQEHEMTLAPILPQAWGGRVENGVLTSTNELPHRQHTNDALEQWIKEKATDWANEPAQVTIGAHHFPTTFDEVPFLEEDSKLFVPERGEPETQLANPVPINMPRKEQWARAAILRVGLETVYQRLGARFLDQPWCRKLARQIREPHAQLLPATGLITSQALLEGLEDGVYAVTQPFSLRSWLAVVTLHNAYWGISVRLGVWLPRAPYGTLFWNLQHLARYPETVTNPLEVKLAQLPEVDYLADLSWCLDGQLQTQNPHPT